MQEGGLQIRTELGHFQVEAGRLQDSGALSTFCRTLQNASSDCLVNLMVPWWLLLLTSFRAPSSSPGSFVTFCHEKCSHRNVWVSLQDALAPCQAQGFKVPAFRLQESFSATGLLFLGALESLVVSGFSQHSRLSFCLLRARRRFTLGVLHMPRGPLRIAAGDVETRGQTGPQVREPCLRFRVRTWELAKIWRP